MRSLVQCVYLTLPPPISANAIWRSFSRNGRLTAIKSQKYREWIKAAGEMILLQNPGRIDGSYGLKIHTPKKCRIDLDNVPKAINDLAQHHGIISNDRKCANITISRGVDDQTHVWFISTKGDETSKGDET